jgi:hypothetical protein
MENAIWARATKCAEERMSHLMAVTCTAERDDLYVLPTESAVKAARASAQPVGPTFPCAHQFVKMWDCNPLPGLTSFDDSISVCTDCVLWKSIAPGAAPVGTAPEYSHYNCSCHDHYTHFRCHHSLASAIYNGKVSGFSLSCTSHCMLYLLLHTMYCVVGETHSQFKLKISAVVFAVVLSAHII